MKPEIFKFNQDYQPRVFITNKLRKSKACEGDVKYFLKKKIRFIYAQEIEGEPIIVFKNKRVSEELCQILE